MDVKLKKITKFLEAGHKVRITVFFRGREMAHKDLGYKLLEKIMGKLGEAAVEDQKPQMSGKYLSMTVRSNPSAKTKDA